MSDPHNLQRFITAQQRDYQRALDNGFGSAADAARTGAEHTATLLQARVGRASYLSSQQLEGHNDPGAEAVARLFEHLAS